VVKALHSFLLESFLSTIKNDCHLLVASLLIESFWPSWEATCAVWSAMVLTGARYLKLETLSKENLIEVESGRRGVEPYFFACRLLKVRRSCLVKPIWVRVRSDSKTGDLVFYTKFFLVLENHFFVGSLRNNLFSWNWFRCQ
jgi:hypothetical protein